MISPAGKCFGPLLWVGLLATLTSSPAAVRGQAEGERRDSLGLLEEARDIQARVERYREQRTPPELASRVRRCDEVVGRFCFRFEELQEGSPWEDPHVPVELELARNRAITKLGAIARKIPGDPWVLGQRVYYLGEANAWQMAGTVARRCGGRTRWWCTALLGYVHHRSGRFTVAEKVFDRALQEMPPDTAAKWRTPKYLLRDGGEEVFAASADVQHIEDLLWTLSDPLYLVAGNDRKTEQYARQVLIRLRAGAVNGMGLDWDEDLEQITLQWGAERAWSRERDLPTGDTLVDSRRMISHRWGREFLPSSEVLENPSRATPEEWRLGKPSRMELRGAPELANLLNGGSELQAAMRGQPVEVIDVVGIFREGLAKRGPRTGYTPPYAPTIDRLDTQVARFRRGDSLLIVGAFSPAPKPALVARSLPPTITPEGVDFRARRSVTRLEKQRRADNPFAVDEVAVRFLPDTVDSVESGMFLIDTESGAQREVRGEGPEGAFQLQVPNGHYVIGIEAFESAERRAWRERHGVWQEALVPGLAAISDLLVLEGGGGLPNSLDQAIPTAMSAVHISAGAAFQVAWELYGLRIGESATVRIGVDDADPGLLRRLGELVRLVGPDDPVVMTWEEAGPDVLGTVFRAVEINLPELAPGDYSLTVEVQLPGREPMTVTRAITIVE